MMMDTTASTSSMATEGAIIIDEDEGLAKTMKDVVAQLQEQSQVISLLQAQVDFQGDRISAQDKVIKELEAKVLLAIEIHQKLKVRIHPNVYFIVCVVV
jgi:uncharacterized protein (DUF169 family)